MIGVPRCAILGVIVGLIAGLTGGIRWVVALAASGGPVSELVPWLQHRPAVLGLALLALLSAGLWLSGSWPCTTVLHKLRAGASFGLGAGSYAGIVATAAAVEVAFPGSWPWLLAVPATLLLLAAAARRAVFLAMGVALTAALLPWSRGLDLALGDVLARQALVYSPFPAPSYWTSLVASSAALGLCIGAACVLIDRRTELRAMWIAGVIGLASGTALCAAQAVVFVVSMRTAHDPAAVLAAMCVSCVGLGLILFLQIHAWMLRRPPRVIRALLIGGVLIVGSYVWSGLYGCGDYHALSRLHPDGVHVYIHFSKDGAHQRTIDQSASTTKSRRAQAFLARYPFSAYRPAALLLAAQSQFEEWQFARAAETLAQSATEYPHLDGQRDMLWAFADMANGRAGSVLRTASTGRALAAWRATVGAQTAGDAAARLGLARRAYGLHSAYIDYLAASNAGHWRDESARYSLARMDEIAAGAGTEPSRASAATVIVPVIGPHGPVRGARVVLVQPHANAAFPADSYQFTGAWTLPAWNAVWATTDGAGLARISGVTHGQYEIVLGLGLNNWPVGTVAAGGCRGVVVDSDVTVCEPIRLIPAVKLRLPVAGETVYAPVVLKWDAYPGAVSYAVTVMEVKRSARAGYTGVDVVRGRTCWAKAGIRGESTIVDSPHFVDGDDRLRSGMVYMWMVHATGSDGRTLSSSEHYFDLSEPTFAVGDNRNE